MGGVACGSSSDLCGSKADLGAEESKIFESLEGKVFMLTSYQGNDGALVSAVPGGRLMFHQDMTFFASTGLNRIRVSPGEGSDISSNRFWIDEQQLKLCGTPVTTHAGTWDPTLRVQDVLFFQILEDSPTLRVAPGSLMLLREGLGTLIFQSDDAVP